MVTNDALSGGLADNKSLEDIAQKHNLPLDQIQEQFEKGLMVESEHTDDKEKAGEIVKDHLFEMADYYDKLEKMENATEDEDMQRRIEVKDPQDIDYKQKQKEKDMTSKHVAKDSPDYKNSLDKKGEIFYIRHCKAGLAKYPTERILIQDSCLKQMMPTMAGIPIYIDHVDEVDLNDADGYVSECFYNELDGCYWAKSIITNAEAVSKLNNGYGASNAYLPKKMGTGGLYHGDEYDREVLEAEYTHLAIVSNPRYNESLILTPDAYKQYNEKLKTELQELTNSLDTTKEKPMTVGKSIFRKFADMFTNAADEEEKDEKQNSDDEMKKLKDENEELKEKLNKLQKKNEDSEKKESEEKENCKKNEDSEEKDEQEDEKKNAQFFNDLKDKQESKDDYKAPEYWTAVKGEKDGYESYTK